MAPGSVFVWRSSSGNAWFTKLHQCPIVVLCTSNFYFIRPRVTIFNFKRTSPNDCIERYFEKVVLLILESLGSTELVFILVMALVFFGPRKLPQISRSLGKNLADFRRASEDFKRTWDREANLEESASASSPALPGESSILNPEMTGSPLQAPSIASVPPDQVIARHTGGSNQVPVSDETNPAADPDDFESVTDEPKHSPKNDWL
jgi:TatA/E family protein of Tat protein translocase